MSKQVVTVTFQVDLDDDELRETVKRHVEDLFHDQWDFGQLLPPGLGEGARIVRAPRVEFRQKAEIGRRG